MKKKIMAMLIATTCLATTALNSAVAVCAAEKSNPAFLMGDVNEDGSFGVSDVVLLQKWLLAVPDTHLANWRAADFCEDEKLDVFDLTLMKRELLKEINNPDEPPTTEIAALEFNSTDDAVKAINANDLSDYYSPYREAYESMFERFRDEGFIFSVNTNDNVAFAENSKIRLHPEHTLEDMGIKYSIMYHGNKYNVSFRYADMDVIAETDGITEYVRKRWDSNADHEIMIGDTTYTISNATDGSQIAAMAFIDVTHYIQVIGFESVEEEELTELLNALEYETRSLDTISEPPATEIGPLDYKTTNDVIKAINENDLSDYPSPYKEAYEQMFESFKNDGYIYSVKTDDNIILKNNSNVRLRPYQTFSDINIKYSVVFKNRNYDVAFFNVDANIAAETNGITEYIIKRCSSNTDHEVLVNENTYAVSQSTDGSQLAAVAFLDDKHYIKVIGYESVSEEELKDFLNVLEYEKLDITATTVTDPITPVTAQPIEYKNMETAIEAINNNDVNAYPESYYDDYRKMFERFQNDGFIYQVTDNDLIKTNKERGTTLFPSASYEDVGVGYFVTFKGNNYHILFYSADADVLAETDGIAAYLKKRMGRSSDKEIDVNDKNVSLLFHENGQCYANAFVDENHYFDVIGAVSETELIEFLNAFAYEKTVF
jgi:hypothetical protein